MSKVKRLPARSRVKPADTWDLGSLYKNDTAWKRDLNKLKKRIPEYQNFKGHLGDSAATLADCLKFDSSFDRLGERLGVYAFLKTAEDQTNGDYQHMMGQYQHVASKAAEEASFIRPEILAISDGKLKRMLKSRELAPYRLILERLLRKKPHTLGDREEQLLAMQSEMAQTAGRTFRQLLDADMKFGVVTNEKGEQVELSNATFSQLLVSPARKVRKQAFETYYDQFKAHENTLAATLSGSIQKDVYYASCTRIRQRSSPSSSPGQRAAKRLRQIDQQRAPQSPRTPPLLRFAQTEDEAAADPSLRHLCPHSQRSGDATFLEASR